MADVRDYFANVFVNQDTCAAVFNLAGFLTDFCTAAGVSVDAVKAVPKVGKFVTKFSKDVAKAIDAIRTVTRIPGFNKMVPQLAGAIPAGAYENIAETIGEGSCKILKSDYKETKNLFMAANQIFDVGSSLKPQKYLDELVESGVKCNFDEIIGITKMPDGKLVWLEKGHLGDRASGFAHVLEHESQFVQKGIMKEDIPDFILQALSEGKVIGYQPAFSET